MKLDLKKLEMQWLKNVTQYKNYQRYQLLEYLQFQIYLTEDNNLTCGQ